VQVILDRSFNDLKGINDTMRASLRRILAESLTEGVAPREMARRITAEIDAIGIRRAMLIARTEVIAAHHLANISEYRQAGILGIRLQAEWLTAGDKRVCSICRALAVKDSGLGPGIYTLDQIEFMIPAHPACRCMAIPVDVTDVPE
jgi:SPP1 gp7 family putative phage head morphogenesis protein